ncbi:MAG: glycosyltransferase, partial [Planctomycetota bacterium]
MPTYNTRPDWLQRCVESVRAQIYPNWELCLYDDGSPEAQVAQEVRRLAAEDERIRAECGTANRGIAAASNGALALATGEFVALLDHDDELTPDALARM